MGLWWWWGTLIISFWFWATVEKQPAHTSNMIVNFSVRLKLWFAVSFFKNASALMRSAHSYAITSAAISKAWSKAEGVCTHVFQPELQLTTVYLRTCNVFIYFKILTKWLYYRGAEQETTHILVCYLGACINQRWIQGEMWASVILQMRWKGEYLKLMLVGLRRLIDIMVRTAVGDLCTYLC